METEQQNLARQQELEPLLTEMGYEVYNKPHSHQMVAYLKQLVQEQAAWTRVGANAELITWSQLPLKKCLYLLDVALEWFYTGKTRKHSALFNYGTDPITQNLPQWFQRYNGRQTIETGIKESKQVFCLHHIKVRSEPAIYLQICLSCSPPTSSVGPLTGWPSKLSKQNCQKTP